MEFLIPITVLVVAAALAKGGKVAQFAPLFAWVALIGVFIALQQGVWLTSASLVAATCLGVAASLPVWNPAIFRARAVWGAPLLVLPLGFVADAGALADPYFMVLLAAALTSTVAGVGVLASAALAANSRGLAPAAAASVAGVLVIGWTRTPIGDGLQVPLNGGSGPLFWELQSIERMPEGLRLLATFGAPEWLTWVGVAAGILALVAFVAGGRPRVAAVAAGLGAVLSGVSFAALRSLSANSLPDAKPFLEHTRLTLQNRQIDPIMAETAAFVEGAKVSVDHAALAPELAFWVLGCVLLAATAWFARIDSPSSSRLSRDLYIRGTALVWLGWFLMVLFYSTSVGALGIFAAGEWIHLGLVMLTTAVAFLGWRQNTIGARVLSLGVPVVVAAWVFFTAVAWVFKSVLGISMVLG